MPIYLVPYDPEWPDLFAAEARQVKQALSELSPDVEHIGSTAIPGMAAKPVIDLMVLIDDIADAMVCFDPLEMLGYQYHRYAEDVFPKRRWFCKPNLMGRTHHLHLVERGSDYHVDHLLFRDWLRANEDAARRYDALKRQLAARFPNDREAYTDGKGHFIAKIVERAREIVDV